MGDAQEQFMGLYKAVEAEFLKGYEPAKEAKPGEEQPKPEYPENGRTVATRRSFDFIKKLKTQSFQHALDRLAMMAQTAEDQADFASLEKLPQYVRKYMLDKYPKRIAILSHLNKINPMEYDDSAHEAKWLVVLGRGLEYCANSGGLYYPRTIDIVDALDFGFMHDIGMVHPTVLEIIASGEDITPEQRTVLKTHGSLGANLLRAIGYKMSPALETAIDFHPDPKEDTSEYAPIAAMVRLVESFCGIAFPNKQSGKSEATIVDKRYRPRLSWVNVFKKVRQSLWTPEELGIYGEDGPEPTEEQKDQVTARKQIFTSLDANPITPKVLKREFDRAKVLEKDIFMVPYIVLYALARPD